MCRSVLHTRAYRVLLAIPVISKVSYAEILAMRRASRSRDRNDFSVRHWITDNQLPKCMIVCQTDRLPGQDFSQKPHTKAPRHKETTALINVLIQKVSQALLLADVNLIKLTFVSCCLCVREFFRPGLLSIKSSFVSPDKAKSFGMVLAIPVVVNHSSRLRIL